MSFQLFPVEGKTEKFQLLKKSEFRPSISLKNVSTYFQKFLMTLILVVNHLFSKNRQAKGKKMSLFTTFLP